MGVNMKIKLVYGVKIPYTEGILDNIEYEYISNNNNIGYLDDCYNGKWVFLGKQLQTSNDFRDNGWDDFFWECKITSKDKKEVDTYLKNHNINDIKPSMFCLTYYS